MPYKKPDKMKMNKKLAGSSTEEERKRFNAACDFIGLKPTAVGRLLALAFADHVEARGEIAMPFQFKTKPEQSVGS